MTLTKEQLDILKKKLEAEKADLEEQIKDLQQTPDFGHDVDHFEEAADKVEDESRNLGMEQTFKERLENINRALLAITHGTYGICEKCKQPIAWEVLRVDPESRYCKACKKARH